MAIRSTYISGENDNKSRDDVAWVEHALDVLNKLADLRLLVNRAQSASRGLVSTGDRGFATEFRDNNDQIPSSLPELRETVGDTAGQTRRPATPITR